MPNKAQETQQADTPTVLEKNHPPCLSSSIHTRPFSVETSVKRNQLSNLEMLAFHIFFLPTILLHPLLLSPRPPVLSLMYLTVFSLRDNITTHGSQASEISKKCVI